MGCNDKYNNINKTFIIEGSDTISGDTYITTGYTYGNDLILNSNNGGVITIPLPINIDTNTFITNGTYDNNSGIITLTNNDGTYIEVSGVTINNVDIYTTGSTLSGATLTFNRNDNNNYSVDLTPIITSLTNDIFVTGVTYSNNTITISQNNNISLFSGGDLSVTIDTMTGLTVNGILDGNIITSGGTDLTQIFSQTDYYITGGTISGNNLGLNRNDGNIVNIDISSLNSDIFVTGLTFDNNTYDLTLFNNNSSYYNVNLGILSGDTFTTGGTYDNNSGTITFINNNGSSFSVSGFNSGFTDTYTSGLTYSNNILNLTQNNNFPPLNVVIDTFSGLTVNGVLSATTIYGDGSNITGIVDNDTYLTGGTYNSGVITFNNNSGGTFNITGLYTGNTDTFVSGSSFNNLSNILTISRNDGQNFNVDLSSLNNDVNVTGGTYNINTGVVTFTNNSGGTFNVTGFTSGMTDTYTTGSTFNDTTKIATFTKSDGGTYNLNLSSITTTDYYVTGGTISGNNLELTRNDGNLINIDVTSLNSDIFTSGLTFNNSNYELTLLRNDGQDFIVDLSILNNDVSVTGGTYDNNNGIITFTNNSGGTFNISGFTTGMTDTYLTGLTYSNNTLNLTQNNNLPPLNVVIDTFSGLTVNGILSATTIYGDGTNITGIVDNDTYLTGGTYNSGVITFNNNSGGTFNITGLYTGNTDTFVSGSSFNNLSNILTISRNDGQNFNVDLSSLNNDVNVTGGTYDINTGVVTFTNNSGGTFNVSGFTSGMTDTYLTGLTYSNNTLNLTQNNNITPLNVVIDTFSGLTVNGVLSATTIYGDGTNITGIVDNDTYLTGGTYNSGTLTFTNNSGTTFNISGLTSGNTDTFVSGSSFNNLSNILTINRNDGQNFIVDLSSLNNDISVTGGTYDINTGVVTFTNNSGGTFNVSGFTSGMTDTYLTNGILSGDTLILTNSNNSNVLISGFTDVDTYVTGLTYSNNTLNLYQNNNITPFGVNINTFSGLTVNGVLSATTIYGDGTNITGIVDNDTYLTGGTYNSGTLFLTNNSGNTVTISGLSGDNNFLPLSGGTLSGQLTLDDQILQANNIFGNNLDIQYNNLYFTSTATTFTFPINDGNNGYVLTTDGNGVLSFTQPQNNTSTSYWSASTGVNSLVLSGSNSVVTGNNSIAIGDNIIASGNNTTYVNNLNINTTPLTGVSGDKKLVLSSNGTVKVSSQDDNSVIVKDYRKAGVPNSNEFIRAIETSKSVNGVGYHIPQNCTMIGVYITFSEYKSPSSYNIPFEIKVQDNNTTTLPSNTTGVLVYSGNCIMSTQVNVMYNYTETFASNFDLTTYNDKTLVFRLGNFTRPGNSSNSLLRDCLVSLILRRNI